MHTGRVGSVVIGEMLRLHPAVLFDHDPLHNRRVAWVARHGPGASWRENPRWEIMRRPWRARERVYGVVVKPGNFETSATTFEAMLAFLARILKPKRVAMTRRNLLRQIISGCRAIEGKQWHVTAGTALAGGPLLAPPDRLPRFFGGTCTVVEALTERETWTAQATTAARLAGANGLHLVYEDHIEADPRVGYGLVCQLMGLPPEPARPTLVRTGNKPIVELVAQPAEWAAALRGTRWDWMLEA
jgi:hypothetical protein